MSRTTTIDSLHFLFYTCDLPACHLFTWAAPDRSQSRSPILFLRLGQIQFGARSESGSVASEPPTARSAATIVVRRPLLLANHDLSLRPANRTGVDFQAPRQWRKIKRRPLQSQEVAAGYCCWSESPAKKCSPSHITSSLGGGASRDPRPSGTSLAQRPIDCSPAARKLSQPPE